MKRTDLIPWIVSALLLGLVIYLAYGPATGYRKAIDAQQYRNDSIVAAFAGIMEEAKVTIIDAETSSNQIDSLVRVGIREELKLQFNRYKVLYERDSIYDLPPDSAIAYCSKWLSEADAATGW